MKKLFVISMAAVLVFFTSALQLMADDHFRLSLKRAQIWKDKGIVYGAGPEKAYYPSVIFDLDAFGLGEGPFYKMWYSDGADPVSTVSLVTSWDGKRWSDPNDNGGFDVDKPHHVQVVYDAGCFGDCYPDKFKYKIWYWNASKGQTIYSISAIRYAESKDGITWINDKPITQDDMNELVTGGGFEDWNAGSYGPVDVIYQLDAINTGDNPWDYSYVMFYDGTNGADEETGLAYSANGKEWTAYAGNPVLSKSPLPEAWDSGNAVYGTVLRERKRFHFWYSGGNKWVHEGIGYAFSLDGMTWTKAKDPIFHISDGGADHRGERTYTPAVIVNERGRLRMYFSAKSHGGDYAIGLAVQKRRENNDD